MAWCMESIVSMSFSACSVGAVKKKGICWVRFLFGFGTGPTRHHSRVVSPFESGPVSACITHTFLEVK